MGDDTIKVGIEPEIKEDSAKKTFKKLGKSGKKAGKKTGEAFESGFKKSVGRLDIFIGAFAANLASKAVSGIGRSIKKGSKAVIAAARIQETAVNDLNSSLRTAGTFTQQASKEFQALAASLEETTTLGDETILGQAALARNFTTTNEEARKLTKAAVELSAATGQTLEFSVRNLGKTFGGLTGELGESVPIIRSLSKESLIAGGALDLILKRFAGAAAAKLNTFDGAMIGLKHSFTTFIENIGSLITKSPNIIKAINLTRKGFSKLAKIVVKFNPELKAFALLLVKGVVKSASFAAEGIAKLAEKILFFKRAVSSFINRSELKGLKKDLAEAQKIATSFGKESVKRAADLRVGELQRKINAIEKGEGADKESYVRRIADLAKFKEKVAAIEAEILGIQSKRKIPDQPTPEKQEKGPEDDYKTTFDPKTGDALTSFGIKIDSLRGKAKGFGLDYTKMANQVKIASVQGIGKGVAGGFAAMGAALARGENAIKAFAKAFIQGIAQAAIQLGTRFILEGVAISFNPLLGGPAVGTPLIAAGAALATFGGVLGAVAAGGGGAGAGAAAGGGGQPGAQDIEESPLVAQVEEREEPSTQVALTINGDVLDSDETGGRIITLLNDAFDKQGVVINNGSFA